MEVLELEAEVIDNQLTIIIDQSGVEKTKSEKLLEMFTPYFIKMGEIENKIKVLNSENPGKEDVKIAREIRLALKNNRVAAEKVKDDSKAAILIEGRLIDNLNNIVKNTSKGLELQCEQIEKDAEIKEAARVAALKAERAEQLAPYVEDASIFPLGGMSEDSFNDLLTGSKLAYEAKLKAACDAEEKRIADEKAFEEEQKRIRLENEKLKSEAEKRENELQAERAEALRILKIESDKQAAILKSTQDKAAAELKKQREESDRLAAELKKKQDAEKAEAAKKEAEKKENIAAEKKAAKAPDKEKIKSAISNLPAITILDLKTKEAQDIADLIREKYNSFKVWAQGQIEAL